MTEKKQTSIVDVLALAVSVIAVVMSAYALYSTNIIEKNSNAIDLYVSYLKHYSVVSDKSGQGYPCATNGKGGAANQSDCLFGLHVAQSIYHLQGNEEYWLKIIKRIIQNNSDEISRLCDEYDPNFKKVVVEMYPDECKA